MALKLKKPAIKTKIRDAPVSEIILKCPTCVTVWTNKIDIEPIAAISDKSNKRDKIIIKNPLITNPSLLCAIGFPNTAGSSPSLANC
jgi:uncharacterized C2H2 Zn-finger protein